MTMIVQTPAGVAEEVLTVSVEVPEPFAIELELNEQVGGGVPAPVTAQVSATVPVKPPIGAIVIVDVDEDPAVIEAGARAGAEIVKSDADTVRLTIAL